MARVDYYAIEQEIKTVLEADAALAGVTVTIEEELMFGSESTPWIGVYLDRRDAPPALQRLGAGQSTRFLLRFPLWCWEYHLESITKAIQRRDDLVGKIEVALMKNRTLSGKVATSWLEGGELPSARLPEQAGFVSGAEVILVAEVSATTV